MQVSLNSQLSQKKSVDSCAYSEFLTATATAQTTGGLDDKVAEMRSLTRRGFMKMASLLSLAGASAAATGAAAPATAAGRAVTVGSVSSHPIGKTKLYTRFPNSSLLGGYGLLITRTGTNVWRAFSNQCTHEGSLVNYITGNTAICTNHGYTFDAKTGACTNRQSAPLRKYAVKVVKGKIVVTI